MTDHSHNNRPADELLMVGLNHRTAPLELRERLAFNNHQVADALARFRAASPEVEAVILATCNRVELYCAAPGGSELAKTSSAPLISSERLKAFLADFHGIDSSQLVGHTYERRDEAVVRHLFAVTSSLDSMVLGETQILSQVKQAYQLAVQANAVGPVFHAMFQRALAAAKDVHEQTDLAGGRVSVASVAVDLVQSVFDRFDNKVVLLIGAGKMAALMLRHMAALKPGKIVVANRSAEKAAAIAAQYDCSIANFAQLDPHLVEADIVLTGTGATEPLLTTERMRGIVRQRSYRPLVMVDVAVPRDVEAGVGKLSNVYLYNVDDLEKVVTQTHARRTQAVDQSMQLLQRHEQEFVHWLGARNIGPVVKALYQHCHHIGHVELQELLAAQPGLTTEQRQAVGKMVHRVISKLLHHPVTQLSAPDMTADRVTLVKAMEHLFKLDDAGTDEPKHL